MFLADLILYSFSDAARLREGTNPRVAAVWLQWVGSNAFGVALISHRPFGGLDALQGPRLQTAMPIGRRSTAFAPSLQRSRRRFTGAGTPRPQAVRGAAPATIGTRATTISIQAAEISAGRHPVSWHPPIVSNQRLSLAARERLRVSFAGRPGYGESGRCGLKRSGSRRRLPRSRSDRRRAERSRRFRGW